MVVGFGKRVLAKRCIDFDLVYLWWLAAVMVVVVAAVTRLLRLTWPMQVTLGEEGSAAEIGIVFTLTSLMDRRQNIGKKMLFWS